MDLAVARGGLAHLFAAAACAPRGLSACFVFVRRGQQERAATGLHLAAGQLRWQQPRVAGGAFYACNKRRAFEFSDRRKENLLFAHSSGNC
jgi:hypothetical protein